MRLFKFLTLKEIKVQGFLNPGNSGFLEPELHLNAVLFTLIFCSLLEYLTQHSYERGIKIFI